MTGRMEEVEQQRRQSLAAWQSAGPPVPATFPHGQGLAHYRLGELLHLTGRTEEARQQFEKALAIMEELAHRRPQESICHWQLICLLANCPDETLRDPARAVALAQRVLPKQAGDYWRYLALAQYRNDQWQAAADSIQQAMKLRQGRLDSNQQPSAPEAMGRRLLTQWEDERNSLSVVGLRRQQQGFQPYLTFQIFQDLAPFSKGSVPELCHMAAMAMSPLNTASLGDAAVG